MILLDSDVLLLDQRYKNDPRHGVNRQFLDDLKAKSLTAGITQQALLEAVGVLSFQTAYATILTLPNQLASLYGLKIVPDPQQHPEYAGCTFQDIVQQVGMQMSLGDAVQALQITRFAPQTTALLTWNARHFVGKLSVPVLTPQDWLNQQSAPTP